MNFLIVDDHKTFRDAVSYLIADHDHFVEVAATGEEALATLAAGKFDAVLVDLVLGPENGLDVMERILAAHPKMSVVIFTAHGNVKDAVAAMRRGAVDFVEKPFKSEDLLALTVRLRRLHKMGHQLEQLEQQVRATRSIQTEPTFDFTTPATRAVMDLLLRAASTPATILILGESGTGKSVAARTVHGQSRLASQPFVTVSCPSLSQELLQSELFGHVKGSFTGAIKDHWGKVKAAEGGTLFLDEIGDLPLEIQPKLLRLLQEQEYERLGENVTRRSTVRVIAATNRDLRRRVAEGTFREDLYFRLNVITVEMPPLRKRPEDIPRFAEHYARHFASEYQKEFLGFDPEVVALLGLHLWPGNLREMRNVVERAVVLCQGKRISSIDLPSSLWPDTIADRDVECVIGANLTLERLEELQIRKVLGRASSLVQAANLLGIDQTTLYRKRKRLGLNGVPVQGVTSESPSSARNLDRKAERTAVPRPGQTSTRLRTFTPDVGLRPVPVRSGRGGGSVRRAGEIPVR